MPTARRHATIAAVLGVAFFGRVLVQLVQRFGEVSWLPAFERWQSGAMPYWGLLISQIVILAILVTVTLGMTRGRSRLRMPWLAIVAAFGALYFGFMAFRLVAGFTFADGDGWLDNPLPSIFHLVLASFVLNWVAYSRSQVRVA